MLSGKGGIAPKLNKLQETNIIAVPQIFSEKISFLLFVFGILRVRFSLGTRYMQKYTQVY